MKIKLSIDWDELHRRNIEKYSHQVDYLFNDLAKESSILGSIAKNSSKPFKFSDYPSIKSRFDRLLDDLTDGLDDIIISGSEAEWALSNSKNDEMVRKMLDSTHLKDKVLGRYNNRNIEALNAFQKQKIDGLGISDRVWNLRGQIRQEIEMGIDVGLIDGNSAAKMGRNLQQFLRNPDNLFRRVRNERGLLQLSKNARAFNPGQGVYRSSRANALRLTRTQTNMSYRMSDAERWEQLDFVIGYEVKRSNNPYPCPICEALKGKYPKSFKFIGWHPNCRCFAVPILAAIEDFIEQMLLEVNGAQPNFGLITEIPAGFTNWLNDNREYLARSAQFGTYPYFLKYNNISL